VAEEAGEEAGEEEAGEEEAGEEAWMAWVLGQGRVQCMV
jgi:hypothetical protein